MLTHEDVAELLSDPSAEHRVAIAQKIGHQFVERNLSDNERTLAKEIFRILAADAEVRVREALSEALNDCPDLPQGVAVALANDVNSVALPVIMNSLVLTDDDLVAIIRSGEAEKQTNVAKRSTLSAVVSSNLAATTNETAITTLIANPGADIPEYSLSSVLERYGSLSGVQDAMAERARLPVAVSEKLVALVGDRLYDRLLNQKSISDKMATDIIMRMRSRLIMSLSSESDDERLWALIDSLHRNGRLPPALVIRSACMGDMRFFEAAMATRAGIPLENAIQLIQDPGGRGLAALCRRADIPETALRALCAAVEVARETEYDGGENDRDRFTRRMVERILTQWGDLGVFLEDGDLDYLLGKTAGQHAASAASSEYVMKN